MLTEKVKAVLINTPNNPSGVVYSTPTLQRLADILREKSREYGHIIYLISDEPYREIVFEGVDSPCVSYFYDNTIMCYSFSKSLSLPGERIGYVAVNPACEDAETMIICADRYPAVSDITVLLPLSSWQWHRYWIRQRICRCMRRI